MSQSLFFVSLQYWAFTSCWRNCFRLLKELIISFEDSYGLGTWWILWRTNLTHDCCLQFFPLCLPLSITTPAAPQNVSAVQNYMFYQDMGQILERWNSKRWEILIPIPADSGASSGMHILQVVEHELCWRLAVTCGETQASRVYKTPRAASITAPKVTFTSAAELSNTRSLPWHVT